MKNRKTFVKLPHTHVEGGRKRRTLRTICLLLFLSVSFAVYSQITVSVKDLSLRASLKKIEQVSNYKFFYNESLPELNRKVSLNVKDATIEQIMQQLLDRMEELTYKQEQSNVIVLVRKSQASNQTIKKVTGIVVDENGIPVVGASVTVKETFSGTITDLDGRFSLEMPSTIKQLQVSYIGYIDQTVSLNNKSEIKVTLKENIELLDEVVVVGYGVQKKANLTGAVATVTQETLKDRPVANIGRALQGVIPNLNVTLSSGQPGAGASFNIRGTTSPNGGSPLVLVDGVESSLERINSNDIESITVLKDASSAAIYGARAAFGVILVTTKGGHYNEKPEISYSGSFSVSSPTTSTDFETRGYYSAKIADMFSLSSTGNPYTSYTADEYQALWERRDDVTEHPERPWVITKMRNGKQQYVYLCNSGRFL